MNTENREEYKVRYIKLHFTLQMLEDSIFPVNKVSALRGGMGEMLLRANCVRDRKCEGCDFETECIVRRTMYSRMEIQPAFMTSGDSVGYVLECEDYREYFRKDDILQFQMILFGKTIVYFSQYLTAFYALGQYGLGKEKAKFRIAAVMNSKKESVLEQGSVYMKKYIIGTVADYIKYRKTALEGYQKLLIRFQSPLSLKYRGEMQGTFRMDAILSACRRRIYMLDCFEGIEFQWPEEGNRVLPEVIREEHHPVRVRRYSSRTDSGMELKGIEGELEIEAPDAEILGLLIAGELMHIGKNTSFGFGRYRLMPCRD